jgi:hypothetical protein
MPFRLSCPSCNTGFTVAELPEDRRATCPRCGDVFPLRTWEETATAALPPRTPRESADPPGGFGRTVRVAVVMALLGAVVALVFYFNRERRRGKLVPDPEPAAAATPATQLTGVGYLPADTGVAFAVQFGPVLAYAARTNQDPQALLVKAGVPRQVFDALAQVGLTLQHIDHIAVGTPGGEIRITLVLVLRAVLPDDDEFLQKLKAKKQLGGKPRYDVEVGRLPLTLAQVSSTVWVFGFDAKKDFEAVDRGGYGPGGKQFTPSLAQALAERVPPDAAAWVATSDERWAEKPLVQFALNQLLKKPEWLPVLAKGRAGVLAVSLGEPPRVRLFVRTADDATGQQVRDYFKSKGGTEATVDGTGDVASLDMPLDPNNATATLERFLGDAVRK